MTGDPFRAALLLPPDIDPLDLPDADEELRAWFLDAQRHVFETAQLAYLQATAKGIPPSVAARLIPHALLSRVTGLTRTTGTPPWP
ncbi:hypothetical protein [Poseidonocella sp. HB161398]|uniref:hypothetical protein n=1 Tax=Poseidonocella sp. HB161398 TaxID=2320855 RepID=UPI001107CFA8|nr:hypothetical protein [Poseidonocella sp. HB161398]